MSQDHDDAGLLERARGGDPEGLRMLLERVGPQVWADIDRDIAAPWRSLIDADDVMQVTYLEAFLQIGRLQARDIAAFVSWLRHMARNNLRDAIKELDRKKRVSPAKRVHAPAGDQSYTALVELLGATSTTPSRQVARQETSRIVDAMLRQLPADYGTVVRLYDLEGHDIAEVSRRMSRSAGAVHMLRARAHDRLRSLLTTESAFFSAGA